MYRSARRGRSKPSIKKETVGWPGGYMSTGPDGDVPEGSLSDLTNMDLSPNSLPFIRQSLAPYGRPYLGTPIGIGTFRKTIENGKQQNWEISLQVVPQNEVQTVTITGTPTGGNFTLTYAGQTTGTIAHNASAATVQTALIALSNLATGDVVCTGGTLPGTGVVITFGATLANTDVALITAASGGLTGGTAPAVHVAETKKGGNRAMLHIRKDGEAWEPVAGSYTYDLDSWTTFVQSAGRVYITNGVDKLSFYNIDAGTVVNYTQLTKPATPTPVKAALVGTTYTLYYVVTALSESGETDAAAAGTVQVSKLRESWDGTTEYVNVGFTLPVGALGGKVYVGTVAGQERFIATVVAGASTYRDTGTATAVTLSPPLTNSTGGPTLKYLANITGQLFGWGDINNPSLVWYDGGSVGTSGNFTISGGGGYIAIDEGGPTIPMQVVGYRTGKGDPTPTVLCSGAGGVGAVRHISFTPQTIGNLTALMPAVSDANGDVGSISPLGGVAASNSIHFPTVRGFMYEGSAPNIPNILSANSSSDFIQPDYAKLSLDAMDGAVGIFDNGCCYWALPVISQTNNQIWKLDLRTNPARWVMPWLIPAQYMWHYQDNSGTTHFCLLVNGVQVEFSDTLFSNDNGEPFRTRCASGPVRWDDAGMSIGYVQNERFRLNNVRGHITINVDGTTDTPAHSTLPIDETFAVDNTGFGEFEWGEDEFGEDPESGTTVRATSKAYPVPMKTKLNGLTWEIITEEPGCAYGLGGTNTEGVMIPNLFAGD